MTKILIAEDDQDIRELIVLTLQFNGFEVRSANDGARAWEMAQQEPFDLIILDVRMPRMTGYEVCRRLRDSDTLRDTPVVFLSAKGQEQEIQEGFDAGGNHYILKPFAPEALARTIHEVLAEAASN